MSGTVHYLKTALVAEYWKDPDYVAVSTSDAVHRMILGLFSEAEDPTAGVMTIDWRTTAQGPFLGVEWLPNE